MPKDRGSKGCVNEKKRKEKIKIEGQKVNRFLYQFVEKNKKEMT